MTTWKKVLAAIGVVAAAVLVQRSLDSSGTPELDGLPQQLKPFAREIAGSRLSHVDAMPIIGPTTPWDSKLRGVPYYPEDKPWPLDVEGRPLVMLVQLNFSEMPALAGYPTEGILQIYISAEYAPEKHMWGDEKRQQAQDESG